MKAPTNLARLDVAALAAAGGSLRGESPLASMARLLESSDPGAEIPLAPVTWTVRGEVRSRAGFAAETWMHLQAHARLSLTCQRCLRPMQHDVSVDRPLRFVGSEHEAAKLDSEIEEDVLELPRFLDLHELIEDELLLALPLVPMHDRCPQPLPVAPEAAADTQADHPFAALRSLKPSGSGH